MSLLADSEGPDQTACLSSLIRAFPVCIYPKTCFRMAWPMWEVSKPMYQSCFLIVLGFNDMSILEGHFVLSPREREKRDRRDSRGGEREGQGRKRNRNLSKETEEINTFPTLPLPATRVTGLAQL